MSNLVRFSDCTSSVFISYAHADDELNNSWISNFAIELKKDLEAALARDAIGRPDMPGVYESRYTGPIGGNLGPELQKQVEKSFAMFIIVDEKYACSDWCLEELRYFNAAFGGAGLDQRLYILALRDQPIQAVAAKPHWQQVFAGRSPVWVSFANPDDLNKRPVEVLRDDGRGLTKSFNDRYQALRDDLVTKIRADLTAPPVPRPVARWVIGACTPELLPRVQRFADELGEHEPLLALVPPEALMQQKNLRALMQGATTLILPFNRGQPINDVIDGGHIAQQVAAWRSFQTKRDDAIFLLDLSEVPAGEPAEAQHLHYLDSSPLAHLTPVQLLDRLVPKPAEAAVDGPRTPSLPVRVFIESSSKEPDEWKKLGTQIRVRWNKLLLASPVGAPLSLRTAGFDIDAIDDYALDEADGLVLLWGQKDRRSLLSQINLVEDKVLEPAPAIVARLTPPQPPSARRLPAMQWDVLRFCARTMPPPAALEPERPDDELLDAFVAEVLNNTLRRHGVTARAPRG